MQKDAEHADAVEKAKKLLLAHQMQVAAEKAEGDAKAAQLQTCVVPQACSHESVISKYLECYA